MIERSSRKMRLPARASVFYFCTNAIVKLIGILTTPIFTRLLSGEEYGIYSFYVSTLGVASIISSSVFSQGVLFGGFKAYSHDKLCKSALYIGCVLNLIICVLLFAFLSHAPILLLIIYIQLSCDTVIGIFASRERYAYGYEKICGTMLVSSICSVLLSILLVGPANAGYMGRVYSTLIVSSITAIVVLPGLIGGEITSSKSEEIIYVTDNTIPYIPHALATAVTAQSDRLLVGYIMGADALAKYSVAHSLGAGLLFAVSAVSSALGPWISRKLSSSQNEKVCEPVRILFILLASGTVILTALTPELMRLLAPTEYSSAAVAVFPIALASLPLFLGTVCNYSLVYAKRSELASRASLIGAVIMLICSLVFIRTFGFIGGALSILVSNIAIFALEISYLKRIGIQNTIPLTSVAKAFAVCAVGVILTAIFYDFLWARLIMIIPASLCGIGALLESRNHIFEKRK